MAWRWIDELVAVLTELGGEAQLSEIYERVKQRGKKSYKEPSIRAALERHCPEKSFGSGKPIFYYVEGKGNKRSGKRSGRYGLRESYELEDKKAIEGYQSDKRYLYRSRNRRIVERRKELDNYTCQACKFRLDVKGKYIIECHHLIPLAGADVRITDIEELVSLCPTCHRVAHTRRPPYSIQEIKEFLKEDT